MNYKKLLEILIFSQIIFLLLGVFVTFYPPNEVETFNDFIAKNSTYQEWVLFSLALLVIILTLCSWILTLKLKKIGRDIYLIATLLSILAEFVFGSAAYSSLMYVLDSIYLLLTGATLVTIYYSPLAKEFN
jgi:cytochrome bd-type quinol oxidase subunit 2